jgi:predicted DNA-binding transcriptional regulator YafY
VVQPVDQGTCLLHTGADTLQTLAVYLGMLGTDFQVGEPPELVAHLRDLADRYHRATIRPQSRPDTGTPRESPERHPES